MVCFTSFSLCLRSYTSPYLITTNQIESTPSADWVSVIKCDSWKWWYNLNKRFLWLIRKRLFLVGSNSMSNTINYIKKRFHENRGVIAAWCVFYLVADNHNVPILNVILEISVFLFSVLVRNIQNPPPAVVISAQGEVLVCCSVWHHQYISYETA